MRLGYAQTNHDKIMGSNFSVERRWCKTSSICIRSSYRDQTICSANWESSVGYQSRRDVLPEVWQFTVFATQINSIHSHLSSNQINSPQTIMPKLINSNQFKSPEVTIQINSSIWKWFEMICKSTKKKSHQLHRIGGGKFHTVCIPFWVQFISNNKAC